MLAVRSAGVAGRPRGRRHAAVAEPGRDSEDSLGGRRLRAAAVRRERLDARRRPAARRADARHARADGQFAEQSDRLDDRSRGAARRSSSIAAGSASGSSPTTSTSALYFDGDATCAPSFLDIADRDARVVSTNSFSKAWLMTGWRLGWIVAPADADAGARQADRIQHVVLAGVRPARRRRGHRRRRADGTSPHAQRLRRARDRLVDALRRLRGVDVASPAGAMYAFFRIDGSRRQHGVLPPARARGAARPRAGQRVRARGRGIRSLVLRGERRAARRRRRAARAASSRG